MSRLHLEVSNQYKLLADPIEAAKQLYHALEASGTFPIAQGELSVVFVTDATIAQIHGEFMNDPSATDVITFPANTEMDSAGEIIVSVDHARCRAEELGEPFSRELSLYLVHGWLHLAGYDDRNETDRVAMRIAEQQALKILDNISIRNHFHINYCLL
jgi:probable rRNA maturation factor|tara:strand:+ start:5281 stop:5754 length:474 start_codon:yes stop_codon:yes gene_type:complete